MSPPDPSVFDRMTNIQKSGAVLFAKDPQRVAAFYEALAGLKVTHSGKDIIVLESADSQLMVHPIPARIARTIKITAPPQRRGHAAVKLVFAVASIAQTRARAPALGGELNPPEQMFEARGFRGCDGHDPEGNVIQFREDANVLPTAVKRRASRQSGVDYATVRELALALPDVVDSSTLRGISYKARGKLLACKAIHRSAEPETLMVRVGAADRDRLIGAEPGRYYLTAHYVAYESVLVRLASIDRKGLQALLQLAWNFVTAAAASARRPPKRKKAASVFRYL
jgi:predicted enzyme related to lactoylglutathione lyase